MEQDFRINLIKNVVLNLCEKENFKSLSLVSLQLDFTQQQFQEIEVLVNECSRKNFDISKEQFKDKIETILDRELDDYSCVDLILSGFESDLETCQDGMIYKFVVKLLNE